MYSQLDEEANHHKKGAGIGLALCKHFVDSMNGTIDVKSKYGEDATKVIRENLQCVCTGVPIIAITADAIAGVREKLIEYGMTDYIAKPVEPEKIMRIIRKYLPEDKIVDSYKE